MSGAGSAVVGASAGAGVVPNGVRVLQEHARELREEGVRIKKIRLGVRIKKIQLGARKRHHAAGSAEGRFDLNKEEDVPVMAIMAVVMNGTRKQPRATQDAS